MLLMRVNAYLRRTNIPATRFGREVVGDPNFVLELREGREPRRRTIERVLDFIEAAEAAAHPERRQ
ncbi:hypothetical protein [Sphingosinicella sp. CPCC 101087]|uniref:hypothetical protein n=1 Tax=Sphingosinicella sp. CPCC 101087 TaxID=2497754 RepID=UPI00101BE5DA|nr:hypothetical protein [Sphingosinicella sp. CPCC 101087]